MIKKILLSSLILFFPILSFAHSGRTDSSGGHNCYTGSCSGTYHSHNSYYYKSLFGHSSSSPSYRSNDSSLSRLNNSYGYPKDQAHKLRSSYVEKWKGIYASNGQLPTDSRGDYTRSALDVIKKIEKNATEQYPYKNESSISNYGLNNISTKTCPLFSSYNYLSGGCRCDSGYTVKKDSLGRESCTSMSSYCQNKYGYNAGYDSVKESCKCSYGTVLLNGQCQSMDTVCQSDFGINAERSSDNKCKCKSGYKWSLSGASCIKKQSTSELKKKLVCKNGYIWDFSEEKCKSVSSVICGENAYWVDYKYFKGCKCNTGYKKSGNACAKNESLNIQERIIKIKNKNLFQKPEKNTSNIEIPLLDIGVACKSGFAPSINKKYCVEIPLNAYVVNNETDVWLCRDGYKEVGDSCVRIEQFKNINTAIEIFNPTANPFTTSNEVVEIKGSVPDTTKSVIVNGYTLTKFNLGETEFSYFASAKFKTLKNGKNVFNIEAIQSDGKVLEKSVIINYED